MKIAKIRPKQINEIKSYERPEFINYELFRSVNSLASVIGNVQSALKIIYRLANVNGISRLIQNIEQNASIKGLNNAGAIIFNNGQNNIVLHSSPKGLECKEQEPLNNKTLKSVVVRDRMLIEKGGKIKNVSEAEAFLEKALNDVDFPILKLRRILDNCETQALIDKVLAAPVYYPIKKEGLSFANRETVNQIKSIYEDIFKNLGQINNVVNRSKVKNRYPGINQGSKGSRMLDFVQTKSLKNGFRVNQVSDHDIRQLVIQLRQEDGSFKNMIITPGYTVYKSKALQSLSNTGNKSVLYSKEELENPEVEKTLVNVKQELQKYSDYILDRIENLNKTKQRLSTTEVGTIGSLNLERANLVHKKYMECKDELAKLNESDLKNRAKDALDIECKKGSPSMILKNATPNNESLQISFPIINKERCTKILALKGDNQIKKSFLMQGDKLVKFEAKTLGRSKRNDNKFNYYTNEEIKKSGLRGYLKNLSERLDYIVASLKNKQY